MERIRHAMHGIQTNIKHTNVALTCTCSQLVMCVGRLDITLTLVLDSFASIRVLASLERHISNNGSTKSSFWWTDSNAYETVRINLKDQRVARP